MTSKCPDCDGPAHGPHQAHQFKSSSAPAVVNAPTKQVRVVANKVSHRSAGVAQPIAKVSHNADKCRRYRQAHQDQYRSRNRQRMAKARA